MCSTSGGCVDRVRRRVVHATWEKSPRLKRGANRAAAKKRTNEEDESTDGRHLCIGRLISCRHVPTSAVQRIKPDKKRPRRM